MSFHVPEQFRVKNHPTFGSTEKDGNNGWFIIPFESYEFFAIASDGLNWEHVSVSHKTIKRTPSWKEMCFIKDLFWDEDDVVVQYHPRKQDYVNIHKYVLHLWRPIGIELPTPQTIMV